MKRACALACVLLALGALGSILPPLLSAQDGTTSDPWAAMEKAARAGDSYSLALLVSQQVFNVDGIDAVDLGPVNDRMNRHELRYRAHATSGLPELNVVRAVNAMLDRFGAPGYTHTDVYEVRRLELGLIAKLPSVVAHELPGAKEAKYKQSINPTLSPIEAVLVAGVLIHQKEANGEFLFTFPEQVARWSAQMSGAAVAPNDARLEEVAAAEVNGALAMDPAALLDQPNQLLNDLGIEP